MENSGPRKEIVPLDPHSPGGRQAADAISEVLARVDLRLQSLDNSSKVDTNHPDWRPE